MRFLSQQSITKFKLSSFLSATVREQIRLDADDIIYDVPFRNIIELSGLDLTPEEQAGINLDDDHKLQMGIDSKDRLICVLERKNHAEVYNLEQLPTGTYKAIIDFDQYIKSKFMTEGKGNGGVGPIQDIFIDGVLSNRETLDRLLKDPKDEVHDYYNAIIALCSNFFGIAADSEDDTVVTLDQLQGLSTFYLKSLGNYALREQLITEFDNTKPYDYCVTIFSTEVIELLEEDRFEINLDYSEDLMIAVDNRNRLFASIVGISDDGDFDYELNFILEQLPAKSFKMIQTLFCEIIDFVEQEFPDVDGDDIKSKALFNVVLNLLRQRRMFYDMLKMNKKNLKDLIRYHILPLEFSQDLH